VAEAALAAEPTDENYRHLVEIQNQFRDVQATGRSPRASGCRRDAPAGAERFN
jgi:hypothetical protein